MKTFLTTTSAIALFAGVAAANAEPLKRDYYVSGAIGVTSTSDADTSDSTGSVEISFDNDVNYAIAVGKRFKENWRGEIELSHRSTDADNLVPGAGLELDTTALLVNGYYDFRSGQKLRPYLSAGIGAARHDAELSVLGATGDSDDTVFAYQLGAGLNYAIKERTSLFGGYRYLGSSDPDFDGTDSEYDAHEFRVGVAYAF